MKTLNADPNGSTSVVPAEGGGVGDYYRRGGPCSVGGRGASGENGKTSSR